MRKIVLFPEPFGPSRPTISPGSIANETSVTARRGPYHFVTCCASTTADIKTHKTNRPEAGAEDCARTRSRARSPGSLTSTHVDYRAFTRRIRASAYAL